MAAAYAALLSLSNILHQILNPPPTHHFKFPRQSVKSLGDKVSSLIQFLETFPSRRSHEIEDMEQRIVAAAHEAEDIVESYIVQKIMVKCAIRPRLRSFALFPRCVHMLIGELLPIQKALKNRALRKVIEDFSSIGKNFDEILNRAGVEDAVAVHEISTESSSSTSVTGVKKIMVGFEEHLHEIRSALASDEANLLILPIVGMGGIGKTTLASNVYSDRFIIECFDIRVWVSVSQEYKDREIVILMLQQINSKIDGSELSVDELGVLLHKELFGKKYLIVLDDMWEIQAWDKLNKFLPNSKKKSRILVTTRNVDLARDVGSGSPHEMSFLDADKSWDLIHEYVKVKGNYPIELMDIGKSIARGCRGLPLSLVVIGGLLAESEKTKRFWMYIEENVTSTANYVNNEQCLNVLRLSYNQLPVHLKPCFLYLAVFPKNFEIRMSRLIRLWVAEGFIKAREGRSLEEVAEGYVKDLLDRNLVMTSKRGLTGKVKNCGIHDFIRDLCVAEAQKNKFIWIAKLDDPNHSLPMGSERRLSIHINTSNEKEVDKSLRLGKYNRSLLSYSTWESGRQVARRLKLVRVLDVVNSYSMDAILFLFNSRYITCAIPRKSHVSSCLSLLWNLQTVVLSQPISLPPEFWQMPQLRHLKILGVTLADPRDAEVNDEKLVVLENLQTLATVRDFIFSKDVLRRVPNLKKLGIDCETTAGNAIGSFGLSNLAVSLLKLESLVLKCRGIWENMAFPISLKKLTLSHCQIPWEDMTVVGSLMNLEVLKLLNRAAKGRKWSPRAGEFLRLKFLLIDWCQLEIWESDDSHFPSLEHLQLVRVRMEEFPVDFAHIATFRTIDLNYCSEALFLSAKMMSGEREVYGYEEIQIRSFPSQASRSREKNVVGLEDEAEKLKAYLLEESQELDVISIVGQGGIGKTTLAGKIFGDPDIMYEFPTRIWMTVSEEFYDKNIFISVLREFTTITEEIHRKTTWELAEHVSAYLETSKFLIVLDDVWTLEDWDQIQIMFPRINKWGKVLLTSRRMDVCQYANPRRKPHQLRFLTCAESLLLLQLQVFGKPEFPSELEVEGKLIADRCQGLPLAIVLVGGILVVNFSASKEMSTLKATLKEASESFNVDLDNEAVLNVLLFSYEKLPYHLRKCFLYIGMFPAYYEIPTRKLMRMWISEGFVQEEDNICLEDTAEKYLDDLISSNLLIAGKLNVEGKVKTCSIHDIVREFCFHKATKETEIFFQDIRSSHSAGSTPRVPKEYKCKRICIHSNVLNFLSRRPYGRGVCSFVSFSKEEFVVPPEDASAIPAGFKLLRVLEVMPLKFSVLPSDMYQLLHLRYLTLSIDSAVLPAAFSKFQNIQTLVVDTTSRTLDIKASILNMIELRHFKTNACATLPKPDTSSEGGENIHTLGAISPESCTEDVFDRVRNLKKLSIRGRLRLLLEGNMGSFSSLGKLENLEELKLINDAFPNASDGKLDGLPPADTFPIKLRSLTLSDTLLDWKHMSILGSLENLEVLKLKYRAFEGRSWEASDGGFPHLQVLHIDHADLVVWEASHHPFPRLNRLELRNCERLLGVPVELADAPNFQHLDLHFCRSAAASARKIEAKKRRGANPFHLSITPLDSH